MVIAASGIRIQGIYEIPSLAAGASFDDGNVLELKPGHGDAPFEGPLDLISFCSLVRYDPHPQRARLILDKLNISYLIIECAVVQIPERVAVERPPSPQAVDEGFLRSPDDGADTREIIVPAAPGGIDSQVASIIPDELSPYPVE